MSILKYKLGENWYEVGMQPTTLTGNVDPTSVTVAAYIGELYINTVTNSTFVCTNISGSTYTWVKAVPVATTETTGIIKVGNNLSIEEDGTLSALAGIEAGETPPTVGDYWLDTSVSGYYPLAPEDTMNKVTSISSASTNWQYPSALAVYNYVQSAITNAIEGGY